MIELHDTQSPAELADKACYVYMGTVTQWGLALRGFAILRQIEMLDHADVLFDIDEALRDYSPGTAINTAYIRCAHGSALLHNGLVPRLLVNLEELRMMAESDRLGILIGQARAPRVFRSPCLHRDVFQAIIALTEHCRACALSSSDFPDPGRGNSVAASKSGP